jgi:hypothetical protein
VGGVEGASRTNWLLKNAYKFLVVGRGIYLGFMSAGWKVFERILRKYFVVFELK